MGKVKSKKTTVPKSKSEAKNTAKQAPSGSVKFLTRGDLVKGGNSSSKTKPIT